MLALMALVFSATSTFSACSDKKDPVTPAETVVVSKEISGTASVSAAAYLNLKNNVAGAAEKDAQLSLSGMYGSTLAATADYKLGYFDSETLNFANLKLSEVKAQKLNPVEKLSIETSPSNAASAWLLYNMTTHAVSAKPNRFIVLTKGSSITADATEVYIIKLKTVDVKSPAATYTFESKFIAK